MNPPAPPSTRPFAVVLVPLAFAMHIGARLYFLFALPISVDAAMTFSDYTSHGLLKAMSYYPAPNNHVLHSIFTTFFYAPGDYQTYLIRIPAFLFGVAALWLFYKITRSTFGLSAAVVALAVFGAIQPVLLYGYQARGYSILLFFSLAAVFFWTRKRPYPERGDGFLYLLCIALGIYTIPSHLYFVFAFTVGVALLHWGKESFRPSMVRVILYNIGGVLLALLLYTPIIVFQGIGALVSNKYVVARDSLGFQDWLVHFQEIGEYYLLWEGSLALVALAALLIIFGRKRASPIGIISSGAFLAVLLIPFLHRTLPFPRVWIFAAPFFLWILAEAVLIIKPSQTRFSKPLVAVVLTFTVVAAAAWEYRSVQNIMAREKGSIFHKNLAEVMVEEGYRKVYIQDFYAYAFLPYHLKNSHLSDEVELNIDGSKDLAAEDWIQRCNEQEIMVLETSFRSDSLLAGCLVDTSGVNVLITSESCACIREKLNRD